MSKDQEARAREMLAVEFETEGVGHVAERIRRREAVGLWEDVAIRAMLAFARPSIESQPATGDWVMVPRELTEAMLDAVEDLGLNAALFTARGIVATSWSVTLAAAPSPASADPVASPHSVGPFNLGDTVAKKGRATGAGGAFTLLQQQIEYLTGVPSSLGTIDDYRAPEVDAAVLRCRERGDDETAQVLARLRLVYRQREDDLAAMLSAAPNTASADPQSDVVEALERAAKVADKEVEDRRADQKRDPLDNFLRGQLNTALRIAAAIRALKPDPAAPVSGEQR